MLDKMNSIFSSHASSETGLAAISDDKAQNTWDKAIEDRMNLMKAREEQASALHDSVQHLKNESLQRNSKNDKLIAEFRKQIPTINNDQITRFLTRADELEQKNNEMKRKLDEYKLEGKGKWISFKHEYIHDMNVLEKAVSELTFENGI